MHYRLSREKISSFCGDVLPLYLCDNEGHALYFEDVCFRVEGNAVRLRNFREGSRVPFTGGVLVALDEVGEATVYATHAGKEYACTVSVRGMKRAVEGDTLDYYFADLHNHTSLIHNGEEFSARKEGFQDDYVAFLKNEGKINTTALTDHAETINYLDFFRGFVETERAAPMKTVIFPGAESEVRYTEIDRFGTVIRKSGEIVTFNAGDYCDSEEWETCCKMFAGEKLPVGIFAHPHVVGWSTPGVWDFDFPARSTPEMKHLICGIEVRNGLSEKKNFLHEYSYSAALDAGFRLSPVASSDSHGPCWGYGYMKPKTVLMAAEESREAFLDAFRSLRFYATESGNVRLSFTVNGMRAPATLDLTDTYTYRIECSLFREGEDLPIAGEIISDYGKTVAKLTFAEGVAEGTIRSDTARYFYLRLLDKNALRTFSPPVFTGRAADTRDFYEDLSPLSMEGAVATDLSSGKTAPAVIDGCANTSYSTGSQTPSILIDLGESHKIAAIGHLPTRVVRPTVNRKGWSEDCIAVALPAHYAVSVSEDGDTFTEVTSGVCRVFGAENIIRFAPVDARYVRFDVLDTVGANSHRKAVANANASIGNLSVFVEEKEELTKRQK
ncbi:MAG: discoidin domain-containing protein [Clostridia bacterium]|nr:discoidin domain-containing protein [Clostridia bacterium]